MAALPNRKLTGRGTSLGRLQEQLSGDRDPALIAKLAQEALLEVESEADPERVCILNFFLAASLAQCADGCYTEEVLQKVLSGYEGALTGLNRDRDPSNW